MRGRGGTLLDSGAAFDFLRSRLVAEGGEDHWPGVKWPTSAVRAFLEFVRSPRRRPLLVPPGALVEVHHLARSRRRAGSRETDVVGVFWSFARDELLALGVEEKVVRLSELRRDRLQKFGPLDAALFRLAERRRRAVLVTTDAMLLGSFRACGLSALSPEEVFAGAG